LASVQDKTGEWIKISVFGPLLVLGLFTFVSIPLMEKRSLRRRGPAYKEYAKKTPSLIPFMF